MSLLERWRLFLAQPELSADRSPSRDVHELGRRSGLCIMAEPADAGLVSPADFGGIGGCGRGPSAWMLSGPYGPRGHVSGRRLRPQRPGSARERVGVDRERPVPETGQGARVDRLEELPRLRRREDRRGPLGDDMLRSAHGLGGVHGEDLVDDEPVAEHTRGSAPGRTRRAVRRNMTGDGPKIVIEGTREDWPGGPRTLTPRDPSREPNRQTFLVRRRARPGRGSRHPGARGGPPSRRPPRLADDAAQASRAPARGTRRASGPPSRPAPAPEGRLSTGRTRRRAAGPSALGAGRLGNWQDDPPRPRVDLPRSTPRVRPASLRAVRRGRARP